MIRRRDCGDSGVAPKESMGEVVVRMYRPELITGIGCNRAAGFRLPNFRERPQPYLDRTEWHSVSHSLLKRPYPYDILPAGLQEASQ